VTSHAFSLQSVLKVRQAAVEQCRRAVLAAEQAEVNLQRQLAALLEEQQTAQLQRREILEAPQRLEMARVRSCSRYEQDLRQRLNTLREESLDAHALVAAERDALSQADRAARALERLSEKQAETARRELQHAERLQAQELITHSRFTP
jgi:flagellar biosynthesis chaperone FliJ